MLSKNNRLASLLKLKHKKDPLKQWLLSRIAMLIFISTSSISSAQEITLSDSYSSISSGLIAPFSGVVSPDQQHLYVTSVGGQSSGAVAAFKLVNKESSSRGDINGLITLYKDNVDGIDGLAGAWDVVITADGKNVYVSGSVDNSIVHFKRITNDNAADYGGLTLVKIYKNNQAGLESLLGPKGLDISPDGKHLAVAAFDGNALIQFTLAEDGSLSNPVVIKDYSDYSGKFVSGLSGANDVVYSKDGRNIYIGGLLDGAITIVSRNSSMEIPDPQNPEGPMLPNNDFGKLEFVNSIDKTTIAALDEVFSLVVDAGQNVYAAGLVDGEIVHFKRDLQETVIVEEEQLIGNGPEKETVRVEKNNPDYGNLIHVSSTNYADINNPDQFVGITSLMLDKDEAFFYASSLLFESIKIYRREMISGRVVFVKELAHAEGANDALKSVNHFPMSPSGNSFYTIDTSNVIGHYKTTRDETDLSLTFKSLTQGETDITDLSQYKQVNEKNKNEKIEIPLLPDMTFSLLLEVTNLSIDVQQNVMFATALPEGVEIVTADMAGVPCTIELQHVVCSTPQLAKNESAAVLLAGHVKKIGLFELGVEALGVNREIDYKNNLLQQTLVVNTPPKAENDIIMDYSQQVDIIKNDTDADEHKLALHDVEKKTGKGGTVKFNKGGKYILYNPPEDFDGDDMFTYTISDELGAKANGVVYISKDGTLPSSKPVESNKKSSKNDNWFGAVNVYSVVFLALLMTAMRRVAK